MFAGELKGRLFPPSCASIQLGGLERIESAIHAGATGVPFAMALDTGDMTASPGEAGALELQEALIVLMECGVAVSAVGEKDLMLGLDRWRAVKNQFAGGMAVICANLTDDRGIALVPPAALLPTGGRRVLCVATLSPSFEPELRKAGVEVKIGDPAESVRTALESAPAHDFVILISHAPREESERLHASLSEVDLTITAHAGEHPSLEPDSVDGRPLLNGGEGWRYLSRIIFRGQPDEEELVDFEARAIGENLSRSSLHEMHLSVLRNELRKKGVLARSYAESAARWPEGAPVYVGEQACVRCHAEEHASWATVEDPHASSLTSLKDRRLHRVPQCLQCHATGTGMPGGYVPPAKELAGVSCEACHGPASAHVDSEGSTPLLDARASCARCHTPERSPGFDFEKAWEAVGHGK
jgi:hypothetical protein